jgi:hypothetical protein
MADVLCEPKARQRLGPIATMGCLSSFGNGLHATRGPSPQRSATHRMLAAASPPVLPGLYPVSFLPHTVALAVYRAHARMPQYWRASNAQDNGRAI